MASGRLGTASLAATTNTLIYTVPAGITATINIRMANRAATAARIRVALTVGGAAPTLNDYISYDLLLPERGIVEEVGLVVSSGEAVYVYSDSANVTVRVHGMENN